jgi:hypothetical protein
VARIDAAMESIVAVKPNAAMSPVPGTLPARYTTGGVTASGARDTRVISAR